MIFQTHPGQSKVHLHLCQPFPHAGTHTHTERDEAVGVVLVVVGGGRAAAEPTLRDEEPRVHKLCLVVADGVVTQVELGLERRGDNYVESPATLRHLLLALLSYLLREPVTAHDHLVLRDKASVSRYHGVEAGREPHTSTRLAFICALCDSRGLLVLCFIFADDKNVFVTLLKSGQPSFCRQASPVTVGLTH